MIDSFFEQSVLELDAGAKDFQRAVDNQLSIFEKEKDLHEKTVQELNQKITVLKGRLDDLNAKQHSKENDLQMSMEEIDKIQSEIDSIKLQEQELTQQKEKIQLEFEEKRRRLSEQADVMGKAKEEDEESKELTNGLLFYSQRLQMWFHKDNEGIRITFRCIDKNHPKRRFYVVLNVNDEQKWELLRTKPELSDTTQLVSSLNATNDINGFLRCVRKEFKAQFCDDLSPVCNKHASN
ncbi:hypothetical protein WA577_004837 [Blastocystis sp. JDR]